MTGQQFANYVRYKTKTNSTTLTDADLVMLANTVKDDLAGEIVREVDEDYFQMEFLRDLESGKRFYAFPNDILKEMKTLEAKLDGSEFKVLHETDLNTRDIPTENEDIKSFYSGRNPEFDIQGRGVFLMTAEDIDDVTEGLKIYAQVYPEDITASDLAGSYDLSVPQDPNADTKHCIPRPAHKLWAILTVIEYKNSKPKPIALTPQEANVQEYQESVLNRLKRRNKNRSVVGTTPYNDGSQY